MVTVELPDGRQVTLPIGVWQRLQVMGRDEVLRVIYHMLDQQAQGAAP